MGSIVDWCIVQSTRVTGWSHIRAVVLGVIAQIGVMLLGGIETAEAAAAKQGAKHVDLVEQQISHLQQSLDALASVSPTIYAYIGKDLVIGHVRRAAFENTKEIKETKLTIQPLGNANVVVDGFELQSIDPVMDDQAIRIRMSYKAVLHFGSISFPVQARSSGYITVSVTKDSLNLTPYLTDATLEKVGSKQVPDDIRKLFETVVDLFSDRLSSELTPQPILIPSTISIDWNAIVKEGQGKVRVKAPKPQAFRLAMATSAIMVDSDGIHVLAQGSAPQQRPATPGSAAQPKPASADKTEAVRSELMQKLKREFDVKRNALDSGKLGAAKAALFASREVLSAVLNDGFAGVEVCYSDQWKGTDVNTSQPVYLANRPKFDCAQLQECSPRTECAQRNECRPQTNCRSDNPLSKVTCELGKSVVDKGGCELGKVVGKPVCEIKKAVNKPICEVEKSLRKLGCETNKGFINLFDAPAGTVGVTGKISGDIQACANGMKSNPDVSAISAQFIAKGHANMSGSLKWTPKNLGPVICMSSFKEHFDIDADLDPVPAHTVTINPRTDQGQLYIDLQQPDLNLQLSKTFYDALFVKNPYLNLNCVGGLSVGIILDTMQRAQGKGPNDLFSRTYTLKGKTWPIRVAMSPSNFGLPDDVEKLNPSVSIAKSTIRVKWVGAE